jgi:hypothetical protein
MRESVLEVHPGMRGKDAGLVVRLRVRLPLVVPLPRWARWSAIALGVASTGCGSSGTSGNPLFEPEPGTTTGDGGNRPSSEEDGSTGSNRSSDDGPDGATGTESADAAGDRASDDSSADGDAGSPCSGGTALSASDAQGVKASTEYAAVKWVVAGTTQLVGLWTTMIVPAKPAAMSGTLYVWPGVQPYSNSQNLNPIGDGILQPVLSVGPTCAPGAPNDYASWWISGQYVNVSSGAAGPSGCAGGDGMDVAVGDALDIAMTLSGTVWTQVVTDRVTGKSVQFPMDLKGQGQNWATLAIEEPSSLAPASDVVFTETRLQFAASSPSSCQPSQHGPTDYFATPYVSTDGKSCCVSRVILREKGVAATTMNGP